MTIFKFITLPALIAALVVATNIFAELGKRLFLIKQPRKLVVLIGCTLSVLACLVAAVLEMWVLWWQLGLSALAGLLLGLLVAYGAMYGYDDLYERAVDILSALVGYLKTSADEEADDDASE